MHRRRRCRDGVWIYGAHPYGRHRSWRIGGCIGNFEVACWFVKSGWFGVFYFILFFVTVGYIYSDTFNMDVFVGRMI